MVLSMRNYFLIGLFLFSFATPAFAYTITTNSGSSGVDNFGNTGGFAVDQVAEPITTGASDLTQSISVSIEKVGSPIDNVKVAIQADSGGLPSGTDLASGTISGSSWPSSCGTYQTVTLTNVTLNASTLYWVVYSRTGVPSGTNYYATCGLGSPTTDLVHLSSWATGDGQNGLTLTLGSPPPSTDDYSTSSPFFLASASSTFEGLTGIDFQSTVNGVANGVSFIIGNTLGSLKNGLMLWVIAGFAIVIVCGFIVSAFKFFKRP